MIIAVFAIDLGHGMGLNGSMPWPFNKTDMQWFRRHTLDQVVVMGANTWFSKDMPAPLPNRTNVVFTTKPMLQHGVIVESGQVCDVVSKLQQQFNDKNICIIGGANLLSQAFPLVERAFITRISGNYRCDVRFDVDQYLQEFYLYAETCAESCVFQEFRRQNNTS